MTYHDIIQTTMRIISEETKKPVDITVTHINGRELVALRDILRHKVLGISDWKFYKEMKPNGFPSYNSFGKPTRKRRNVYICLRDVKAYDGESFPRKKLRNVVYV